MNKLYPYVVFDYEIENFWHMRQEMKDWCRENLKKTNWYHSHIKRPPEMRRSDPIVSRTGFAFKHEHDFMAFKLRFF